MAKKTKQSSGFASSVLRSIMAGNDIKNSELAKRLKVSATTISNWKRGVTKPGWDDLAKLAEALGVDYRTFMA